MFGRRGTFVASSGQISTTALNGSLILGSKKAREYLYSNLLAAESRLATAAIGTGVVSYNETCAGRILSYGAKLATGANINSGLKMSTSYGCLAAKNPSIRCVITTADTKILTADAAFFVGIFEGTAPISEVTGALTANKKLAGFHWNGTNFLAVSSAGTTVETTTLTTPTVDKGHALEIIISATSVEFYVEGSLVATHTTYIPTSGTTYFCCEVVNFGVAADRYLFLSCLEIEQDTP